MLTINYTIPIYIRMTPEELGLEQEIEQPIKCYIIDRDDDHNYVSYQTQTTIYDIADFVMLDDAVEYCKFKIDDFI